MSSGVALVTGASGFIGSRLVHALVERGERVRAFVRSGSRTSHFASLPRDRFDVAFGDICVSHSVYAALAGCDRLYHVAAAFKMWDPEPERILEPAIEGTRQTLEAARRRGLDKVVVTSSVASLGATRDRTPMDEDHDFNLDDAETYIVAKLRGEEVALQMANDGLPVVVVLPSGVFGPGDWKPTPSGNGILKYLEWPPSLGFPSTHGGLSIVDVDDVVSGHMAAMDRGKIGERYILGGDNLSYRDMFQHLHDITGLAEPASETGPGLVLLAGAAMEVAARIFRFDPPVTRRLARDYANGFVWVTSAKAERELGYVHRPARETFTRAVRWYLANGYVSARASSRLRLQAWPT